MGDEEKKPDPPPAPVKSTEEKLNELQAQLAAATEELTKAKAKGEIAQASESTMHAVLEEMKGLRSELKAAGYSSRKDEKTGFWDVVFGR